MSPIEYTNRGFAIINFDDYNGLPCSVQESSLAEEKCLWVGVNDARPMILCREAARLGLTPADDNGWMPYPIPEQVSLSTRMHLTRNQARALAEILTHFADTGVLSATTSLTEEP